MDLSDTLKASTSGETIHAHLVADDDGREVDGLARWLVGEGVELTRSLAAGQRPAHGGSRADAAHSPASIPRSARCLIYGPGVSRRHPDRLVALRRGLPEVGCHDMLRGLLATRSGIAVAGRRLGGVAAAMIGWTLDQAGLDPTVLLRGPMPQLGGPGRSGAGRHAVVDITGVLDARLAGTPGPETAVLLDVEGLTPVETAALDRIIGSVGGTVLTGPRHPALGKRSATCRYESVSLDRGSIWWGADLREDRGRFRFRAFHRGRFVAEVRLQVPGRRNVVSALAAVAVCLRADVPTRAIVHGLEDFAGIARGFQSRGSYRGVTLVDDDATEPADVAEAVGLARSAYGRGDSGRSTGRPGPHSPRRPGRSSWPIACWLWGRRSTRAVGRVC